MPGDPDGAVIGLAETEPSDKARGTLEQRAGTLSLTLLPGALIVYFSFEAGGFFPGSVAFVALLITLILVVRVLSAERPLAGVTRFHAAVVIVFAAYAGWTVASALWSHATARALAEFDRALLYLLLLFLAGCVPRQPARVRLMMRGLAGGALCVCAISLTTRVLPHVWPTTPGVANARLSYPIGYWNALGILAAIAILFLLGIASNPAERKSARALSAAGVPIATTTLLLTFSRGGIVALLFGLVIFVLIARSSALVGAMVAILPTTGVAVVITYHANLLATLDPTTPAAVVQGRRVAIAVVLSAVAAAVIRLAAERIDRRVAELLRSVSLSSTAKRLTGAGAVAAILALLVVGGGPAWASKQFHLFIKSAPVKTVDLRARLTDPSGNNRTDNWRAALDAFSTQPVRGTGAGTYEFSWYRYRTLKGDTVVDAHNLYVETLSELGVVGLVALVLPLAAIAVALIGRLRPPDRVLYAALLSAVLAWALHAAVDWDWEVPAVTSWIFAVGGVALAASARRCNRPTGSRGRVPLSLALLVTAVTPAFLMFSHAHLQRAVTYFKSERCPQASAEAISSITALAVSPEPYEILGKCDISAGRPTEAVAALQKAVHQQPDYWLYHLDLSVAQAYAGLDPRNEVRNALRLDPGDSLVDLMVPVLRIHSPAGWLTTARTAYVQVSHAIG